MAKKHIQLDLFEDQDPKVIDFTRIAVYLRCPKEYWYKYLDRDKNFGPLGQKIYEGRLLHKAAEEYLKLPIQNRESETIISRLSAESVLYKSVQNISLMEAAIRLFDNSFLQNLCDVKTEIPFRLKVGDQLFKGRADCLAKDIDGWVLFDFKRDATELEHHTRILDKYLQLLFYAFGLDIKKTIGLTNIKIGYYYFFSGKNDTIELTEDLMKDGLKRIKEIISELEFTRVFPARLNKLCESCMVGAKGICEKLNEKNKINRLR